MNKNKRLLILFMLFLFVGCSNKALPKVEISNENKNIPAFVVSHLWNYDPAYGSPLDRVKPEKAIVVPAKSTLRIEFDYAPNEHTLEVNRWVSQGKRINQILTESNKLIVPEEKGVYVYSVDGEWSEGMVSYAFKIEVK